jgi:hypothetical protein
MRLVVGASISAESCCCRSRLRSSRPNRAIRNSGIGGDNELGADTFSENHSCVGCVAAKWTPIHCIATPLRGRLTGPPAALTPSVKQSGLRRASPPDQTFASHKLPFNSNRGGSGNIVRGDGVAKDAATTRMRWASGAVPQALRSTIEWVLRHRDPNCRAATKNGPNRG